MIMKDNWNTCCTVIDQEPMRQYEKYRNSEDIVYMKFVYMKLV